MNQFTVLSVITAATIASCPSDLPAANLVHDYTLNNTYADSLGGPSLQPNGGTLANDGYTFPANAGLTLSNAFPDPADYSLMLDFRLDFVQGYRKFVDFKNGTTDDGLYCADTVLYFYNYAVGDAYDFGFSVPLRVVLTRDAATKAVTAYVNGTNRLSFTDHGDAAVFSTAGNLARFFMDDANTNGQESSAGLATHIRIYSGALTAEQVADLGSITGEGSKPGDANRNGEIDPGDYALVDRGAAQGRIGWHNGDFNGDAAVDQYDYMLIDSSYAQQGGYLSPDFLATRHAQFGADYVAGLLVSIPEPSSAALLVAGSFVFRRRRGS